jgi:molybdate transport system substrate-binding protein
MLLYACTLLIAAAADLAPLEKPLAAALPDCKITFSFGSSGALSRQLQHGAEFDVFLSASKAYADAVVAAGAADGGTVRTYARGRLGFWSAKRLRWKDLARVSRVAIANPAHAPYGLAAKQVLERQGLWAAVEQKLVYGENVRQAWQFGSTGNVEAVITAWSILHDRGGELLPESWHDPILQVGLVPKRSPHPEAGRRFLDWLTSPAGQKVLRGAGFEAVR